jgi:beta-galactosidase
VIGPRTGYADPEGRPRTGRAPGRLAEAAGVWYDEMTTLTEPVPLRSGDRLPGAGTDVVEGLTVTEAEVLAGYDHPHLGRWAAVATRAVGAGRITAVGTAPDQTLARALAGWLVPAPVGGWSGDPSVTVSTATDPVGARVHIVHNWSWQAATAVPPAASPLTDLLTGAVLPSTDPVPLGPWDVRILRSTPAELTAAPKEKTT